MIEGNSYIARARRCSQLECNQGFVCTETEAGPMCTLSVSSLCEQAACPEGTVCYRMSISTCKLSVAQCINQDTADTLPIFGSPQYSCSPDAMLCNQQTQVCADVFEDDRFLTRVCKLFNCTESDPTSCPSNRQCIEVPDNLHQMLQVPIATACAAPGFVFGVTCATAVDPCPPGLVCISTMNARKGMT